MVEQFFWKKYQLVVFSVFQKFEINLGGSEVRHVFSKFEWSLLKRTKNRLYY